MPRVDKVKCDGENMAMAHFYGPPSKTQYKPLIFERSGGGDRNRTCDILNANQVLYQLSYAPTGE